MKQKLSRKELYDLVWCTPLSSLSNQYNISDTGLRKMCKRLDIPVPKMGHWQKVMFGKRTRVSPLPVNSAVEQEIELEVLTDDSVRSTSVVSEVKVLQLQIEMEMGDRLVVPQKLSNPDKLTHATRQRYLGADRDDWRETYSKYPEYLSISTSKALHPRALRIFDAFVKALRFRNHDVMMGYRTTEAVIFGEHIEMELNERNKMIKDESRSYSATQYVPTGILYFATRPYYSEKTWSDGKVPLEDQLSSIVAYMEVKAKIRADETRVRKIKQREQEEKARLQKELEKRQDTELVNFKLLIKKTERWQQLRLIRGYIDELESKSIERNLFNEEIKEWVQWARGKADWYDPHINATDELLNEVDKETLTFNRKASGYWY